MKQGNQLWQRCSACGVYWPVHASFAEAGIEVECPRCHVVAPFAPVGSAAVPATETPPR